MAGVSVTPVMNPAACHDQDITVLPDMEIIVHHLLEPALTQKHRYMHTLLLRAGLDKYIYALLILLAHNIYVSRRIPLHTGSVGADIVRALRHLVKLRYLLK